MLTVYVKHYLTDEGKEYIKNIWYPWVYREMSKQLGYVAFSHDEALDEDDCINLSVTFESQETIDAWVAQPIHEELITAIDQYRSRPYFEYTYTDDGSLDRNTLVWNTHEVQ